MAKYGTDYKENPERIHVELNDTEKNYLLLAALETIRVHRYIPFNLFYQKVTGLDTTSEILYSKKFDPGYIYIITSICAYTTTDTGQQIRVGVTDGATNVVFHSATISNAKDSVDYIGQLICKDTDKIFAEVRGATAGDTFVLNINGYKIKR